MPSVLIEIGFLSNTKDEDFLASESGQDTLPIQFLKPLRTIKMNWRGGEIKDDKDTVQSTNNEVLPL